MELETDIANFQRLGYVCVIGDLNSRCGTQQEFIKDDILNEHIRQHINSFLGYTNSMEYGDRLSEDHNVNSFGRKLLNMCRTSNLVIMNGRSTSDSNGEITFHNHLGTSVIDYAVVDSRMLNTKLDLNVEHFTEYSDHCAKM